MLGGLGCRSEGASAAGHDYEPAACWQPRNTINGNLAMTYYDLVIAYFLDSDSLKFYKSHNIDFIGLHTRIW